MQRDLGRTYDESLPQHGIKLPLLKEVHQPRRQAVEVHTSLAQMYSARIGLEGLYAFVGQRVGEGQVYEGLGIVVVGATAGVGEGKHLSEPEGEGDFRAGFEGLARIVIKVAKVGDLDVELAWDFLEESMG